MEPETNGPETLGGPGAPCPLCGGPNPFAGDADQLVVGRVQCSNPDAPPAALTDWTTTTICASGTRRPINAAGTAGAPEPYNLPFEAAPVCEWAASVTGTEPALAVFPAAAAALVGVIERCTRMADQLFALPIQSISPGARRILALARANECLGYAEGIGALGAYAVPPGFELPERASGVTYTPLQWIEHAIGYLLEAHENSVIEQNAARRRAAN